MGHDVQTRDERNSPHFLQGGGEMGELIRSMDWSKTPLGPPESWPDSLRTTLNLCLASNFPLCFAWGPHRVQIYNDGYRPICASKHPRSMGQDFKECWQSAWPVIGPGFERCVGSGEAIFLTDTRMFLDRKGELEETFFTFSFSPIRDETGAVAGVFHPLIETTYLVLAQRRLGVLREVASRTADAQTIEAALDAIGRALAAHPLDVPFALLYRLPAETGLPRLAGSAGLRPGAPAAPEYLERGTESRPCWPIPEGGSAAGTMEVGDLAERFGWLICDPYPEALRTALVFPITPGGTDREAAILVVGVSPRRPLDEAYRGFFEMLAGVVTTAVSNAHAHAEEKRRAEALAELDRAKTAFFSNVSHEFRTPLTLILGPVADTLADCAEPTTPRQRERLEIVQRNALRMQKLVNTLLDFSRIEAGRVQASYEATDLATFTAELASNFRSACESAGLELRVKCDPVQEPVYVDRDMWEKVVLNLLSNAFKYTLEGRIEVAFRQVGERVELAVRDTGSGIPADQIPRLFERFYRVEGAKGRTQEGSGIGLALVRELVRLHGGEIRVESAVGQGSVFTVSIPLGQHHLPAERIGASAQLASTALGAAPFVSEALRWGGKRDDNGPSMKAPLTSENRQARDTTGCLLSADARPRILLADDNADMRDYVRRLLAERFEVVAVANGTEALAAAREQHPDLVLSDVMMPGLDGFGLLRELRADPATVEMPIMLLSARAGEEARIEGMEAGADDYLIKPFSSQELLARVGALLDLAKVRRAAADVVLSESEERFRLLVDGVQEYAIFMLDPEGRVVTWNTGAQRIKGYRAEEIIGRYFSCFYPEEEIADGKPEEELHHAMTNGRCEDEGWRVRKDGSRFWARVVITALHDKAGRPRGFAKVTRDITEKRRGEEKFRQAVESAPNGMLMIDPEGKIVLVNTQTEKLFGYNREELLGQPVELLVPERFRSRHPEYRSGFFARPQVRSMGGGRELYGRRKDGSEFPVEIGLNPIKTDEGLLVLSAIVDITERKKAEEVLRESEQRYHILAETMLHGVLHQDASGRIIALNPTAERILGKTREQILGSTSVREEHDSIREDGSPFPGLEHPSMVALRTGQTLRGVVMGVFNPQVGVRRWITIDAVPVYRPGESEPAEVFTVFEDVTERKYAEAEQRKLVNLIEHSRDFIAVADPGGKLTFLNASGRKMIGLDEDEDFSRIQFTDYVPPDWQDFFCHTVIRTAREQGLWEGEMQLRNLQTGARIDVFRSTFYIHDAARGEGYYATVTRDITESKRAERLLRESEEKYRNLFQNMSEEVHFWRLVRDDQGNIRTWTLVDANPPALRTWGKTLEEIEGKTTDAIFGPGASEHYLESVRKIMREGVSYHFEDYFPNLDRYFRFSSVPLGEYFFTTGADITSSKKAHLELEKAHNKLQAVLTSITDGLLVLDRNWVYTYFSEQAGRILGVSPEEVVGRCIWDLFPHASNLKFHEGFHRAVESRQAVHFEEYYPEPLNQWFECHCYPSEEGLSVYFRDVTEPKEAEKVLQRVNADLERGMQQLAEANREAKAKTQENETFVYSVSHDLRSPLVNLQGFSKELGRSAQELRTLLTETDLPSSVRDRGFAILDGKVAKSIHFIQTAVARLSNIIDALLQLSRAGRVLYQRQRVDLRAIVTRVVESLKITTEERRATIQIDELPPALGDPAALEQIFANLIGNALNYLDSKRPGTIEIGSLHLPPDGVPANMRTYSIRDNGLGIPAVSAAKIFQPFQRLHPEAAAG